MKGWNMLQEERGALTNRARMSARTWRALILAFPLLVTVVLATATSSRRTSEIIKAQRKDWLPPTVSTNLIRTTRVMLWYRAGEGERISGLPLHHVISNAVREIRHAYPNALLIDERNPMVGVHLYDPTNTIRLLFDPELGRTSYQVVFDEKFTLVTVAEVRNKVASDGVGPADRVGDVGKTQSTLITDAVEFGVR